MAAINEVIDLSIEDGIAVITSTHPPVNALSAIVRDGLTAAFDLPRSAPLTIFAMARTVGWLAHMLEQVGSTHQIRPRARYVGPAISQLPPAA